MLNLDSVVAALAWADPWLAPWFMAWGVPVSHLEAWAFVLSLAMVAFNLRVNPLGWPLAIVSSLLYGVLFARSRLYGEACLQLVFVALSLWGWWQWLRRADELGGDLGDAASLTLPASDLAPEAGRPAACTASGSAPAAEQGAGASAAPSAGAASQQALPPSNEVALASLGALPVRSLGAQGVRWTWLVALALWPLTGLLLSHITDSDVPYLDALPTAGSLVGQWLLGRKWVENWPCWLLVNVISMGLFAYKQLWLTVILYAVFALLSVLGWRQWLELIKPGRAPTRRQLA